MHPYRFQKQLNTVDEKSEVIKVEDILMYSRRKFSNATKAVEVVKVKN